MLSHIGGQYTSNNSFSHYFKLFLGHIQELLPLHQLEGLSCMIVFLYADIRVPDSPLTHGINMIPVGQSIVPQIVAECRDQQRKHVNLLQLGQLLQIPLRQEQMRHVRHVEPVQVVVVLHGLPVGGGHKCQKVRELHLVKQVQKVVRVD